MPRCRVMALEGAGCDRIFGCSHFPGRLGWLHRGRLPGCRSNPGVWLADDGRGGRPGSASDHSVLRSLRSGAARHPDQARASSRQAGACAFCHRSGLRQRGQDRLHVGKGRTPERFRGCLLKSGIQPSQESARTRQVSRRGWQPAPRWQISRQLHPGRAGRLW